jgi:trans-L-3-hydroxyproline dehydratase
VKVTGAISTVEAHTGGEPFRIVTSGFPRIPGSTILARRKWLGDYVPFGWVSSSTA